MKKNNHIIMAATTLLAMTCCTQQPKTPANNVHDTMTNVPGPIVFNPMPERELADEAPQYGIDSAAVFGDMKMHLIKKSAVTEKGGSCYIEVDYPVCSNDTLKRYLLEYIITELDSFNQSDHAPIHMSDISVEAIDTIVGTCAWQMARYLDREIQELEEECGGHVPSLCGARSLFLKMVSATPKCVSYLATYEEFTGGAHGGYIYTPAVIRRSDGHRLTAIFKQGVEEQMQELLWEALLADSRTEEDKNSYRAMVEEYLGGSSHLPLPRKEPWIAADGVHLQYQSYQVGNWAMGAPETIIPAGKARPFLTEEAAALLEE